MRGVRLTSACSKQGTRLARDTHWFRVTAGGLGFWCVGLLRLLLNCVGVGFNDDVHLGSSFQAGLLAVFGDKFVFDSDFAIQLFGFLDSDLGFLRLVGKRLNQFLYGPV